MLATDYDPWLRGKGKRIKALSLNYRISAYDGAYVALSQRVSAPLLTLDQKLVNALATAPYDVRSFADFFIPPLQ
jgi:predicted nucleic acid-binding protein